jgi:HlyD family secretion protein
MKRLLFWLIVLAAIAIAGGAGYFYFGKPKSVAPDMYKTMMVRFGDIQSSVLSTGSVQPVQSVQVGAVVSGPILNVRVDYNSEVKEGDLLAEVDPMLLNASRDQAQASLDSANANLLQAKAKLEQAKQDWKRAESLHKQKAIADTDYDLAQATFEIAKANVAVAEATIKNCEGALKLAKVNLKYARILSPVDGMITDRKVDPGQTVASQFQTPVLFVVAHDLKKRVHILASVDEADIGMIRDAQLHSAPVTFTVDAYPKDTFRGKIAQIRLTPTTLLNVVTYTVVVEAPNHELKLLPGLTANLTFQIEKHKGVLKIPNAALRFFPKANQAKQVRPCDRAILEGKDSDGQAKQNLDDEEDAENDDLKSPRHGSKARYVWILDGDLLAAVKVTVGLTDKHYTELLTGDLRPGQTLVTGIRTP